MRHSRCAERLLIAIAQAVKAQRVCAIFAVAGFGGVVVSPLGHETSSSAVAERPRDASCLSVVSFSSTILRAPSFIISYFSFKFTAAYN